MDTRTLTGLSEKEAAGRLKLEGYNELPSAKPRSNLAIAFEVVREPMFLLLLAAGTIYLLLGDIRESLFLVGAIFVVIGITLYQERKTERSLEALRDLSSPRALVIRDGIQKRIAGREVVREDVLVLNEGDRVPADAVVLSCFNLSADESLLTGESAPARKGEWDGRADMGRPGGDDLPFVYSGTLITQGQGFAKVHATGLQTELGKIGKALRTVELDKSHLQKETDRVVRVFAVAGLALCGAVVIVYGLTRGDWLHGVLAGLTLSISMVPEEFPVVLTVFLALGAWRISQKRVLTRRIPAIESLGSATVLCVDKTGTLTQNRMSVASFYAERETCTVDPASERALPQAFHPVAEFAALASKSDPFDPMEKAFQELARRLLGNSTPRWEGWTLVREYPLSRDLMTLSHVWQPPAAGGYVVASKGAPEAIARLCRAGGSLLEEISLQADAMAGRGLRVLGVAKAHHAGTELPSSQHEFDFQFLGLVGLADPVRPNVPNAIQECYAAGIRVIMITGDYPGTARNIARQIGLRQADQVITGPELDRMDEEELRHCAGSVNIFARVVPEQKLLLVNALKSKGEVVAMTGDGVNDAPALKAAHIGIAMGGRGSDVAREAASLVLLDDDFSSIVSAVRLGRRIFDNLKKAISFILAIHVPIAGITLIPVILKWPLVLMPLHVVFLEMIIDPACSIAFEMEPEEADVMSRPPRNPQEPLFTRRGVFLSLFQGASVMAITVAVFAIALYRGNGEADARTLTFTTLVIAILSLIFTNRSWTRTIWATLSARNSALAWLTGGTLAMLAMVLYVPFLRDLFRFSTLHPIDVVICFSAGLASIAWFEVLKISSFSRKLRPQQNS